jgi:hypothetical protein
MPTSLVNAPVELLTTTQPADYLPPVAVTVVAIPLLLIVAAHRLRGREI